MAARGLCVFTIPPGIAFAHALSAGVIARYGAEPLALADVQIFVPTRRAVRTLRETFVTELGGAALGPRIQALGDVDEEAIAFDAGVDDLAVPPPIAPLRRTLELALLVQRWATARGDAMPIAQAVHHAEALGAFLDEAATQAVDLTALKGLAPERFAQHWQDVVVFLDIVAKEWPKIREAEGAIEPAARRNQMLDALAARLRANPPETPVIAAGSTGSIPATARLLTTIATLPNGAVVLPGLDQEIDDEAWAALDPAHPQFGLRQLLGAMGATRKDVAPWSPLPEATPQRKARVRFLSEALRPPPATASWRHKIDTDSNQLTSAFDGLHLIEAANPREEAEIIAVALRSAVESQGRKAALVTPDRGLARRVAAELTRWNLVIDDSAGLPLARTPPGAFLALLARAAEADFAPVPLLALLKHPLAAGGIEPGAFRARVRELEMAVLRGSRPDPGLGGIAFRLAQKDTPDALTQWFAQLSETLAPFAVAMTVRETTLSALAEAQGHAAERLAARADTPGATLLWQGPAGEAAAALIAELLEQGGETVLAEPRQFAALFRDLAEARAVRPVFGQHPRLFLLGPLEARLMHFDLTVLGGLNEGTWPTSAATDPWLSRPMRAEIGLEAPERRVGLAAHDFASLAAGPEVVLTRSLKKDGAPTLASRWWQRVVQLARGLGHMSAGPHRYRDWARTLDEAPRVASAPRPAPRPPVDARPRRLSVTEIETWQRDPYAIYARHVLKLHPLDPLDAEIGPRERGCAIHTALEKFLIAFPDALPDDALAQLIALGEEAFHQAHTPPALLAIWQPRFARAARWFVNYERARRTPNIRIATEVKGVLGFDGPAGSFTLRGRADRIDVFPDGSAAVFDYKSGSRVPSAKMVEVGWSPQLPLEATMLMQGAFEGVRATHVRNLIYLQLTGGVPPGRDRMVTKNADDAAAKAFEQLRRLVARYDVQTTGYPSRVMPFSVTDVGDYDHLARVREWLTLGGDVIEEDEP